MREDKREGWRDGVGLLKREGRYARGWEGNI